MIRFQRGFPAAQVAEQLELTKVQPVLVSNELGEILGQSYPERGVLFSFEPADDPGKALKKVTHIVLEPITAEPFVLRAETNIDIRPEFSLHDAEQAIKLQPGNARAPLAAEPIPDRAGPPRAGRHGGGRGRPP